MAIARDITKQAFRAQFCAQRAMLEDVSRDSPVLPPSAPPKRAQTSSFGPSLKGYEFPARVYNKNNSPSPFSRLNTR